MQNFHKHTKQFPNVESEKPQSVKNICARHFCANTKRFKQREGSRSVGNKKKTINKKSSCNFLKNATEAELTRRMNRF
jgi:hypothetical protein